MLGKHIEQFDLIYRGGDIMKTAIVYATKYGCTKKMCRNIKVLS